MGYEPFSHEMVFALRRGKRVKQIKKTMKLFILMIIKSGIQRMVKHSHMIYFTLESKVFVDGIVHLINMS